MATTEKRLPPRAGKGRPKGVPNKVPSDLRAMVLEALGNAGGSAYLLTQAKKKNPAPFLALVGKCVPKDVNVTATVSLADLIREARSQLNAK